MLKMLSALGDDALGAALGKAFPNLVNDVREELLSMVTGEPPAGWHASLNRYLVCDEMQTTAIWRALIRVLSEQKVSNNGSRNSVATV